LIPFEDDVPVPLSEGSNLAGLELKSNLTSLLNNNFRNLEFSLDVSDLPNGLTILVLHDGHVSGFLTLRSPGTGGGGETHLRIQAS
jgi:hypothetical protein